MTGGRDRAVVQQLLRLLGIRGWSGGCCMQQKTGVWLMGKSFNSIFKILPGWVMAILGSLWVDVFFFLKIMKNEYLNLQRMIFYMCSNYQLHTHIRVSGYYRRGITQFRMYFHLSGALIDSLSRFRCDTHHRSRMLTRCAVGAIIIGASVWGILRKMIERHLDSNLTTVVKASVPNFL